MTKEECIKALRALWKYEDYGYSEYEIRKSLDMAIKILGKEFYDITQEEAKHFADEMKKVRVQSQEYCEDAISREELKKWLDMNFSFGGASRKIELFDRLDKELPPVTPKPKYEDIVKAFQIGLAFGFGEKYDKMDEIIDKVKRLSHYN